MQFFFDIICYWCMTQGLVSNVSGDVLVILDLRLDESLYEAGVAREVSLK
jgi:hypothetical protein